jgi:hypothetical protein
VLVEAPLDAVTHMVLQRIAKALRSNRA